MDVQQGAEHELNNIFSRDYGFVRPEAILQKGKKRMKESDLDNVRKRLVFMSELRDSSDRKAIIDTTLARVIKDKSALKLLETESGTKLFNKIFGNELKDHKFRAYFAKELLKTQNNLRNKGR